MGLKKALIHWDSSVGDTIPSNLTHSPGFIVRAILDETSPLLALYVIRNDDFFEQSLAFTPQRLVDEEIDPQKLQRLYDDFRVRYYSGLVGKKVNGIYFMRNNLVGISRR